MSNTLENLFLSYGDNCRDINQALTPRSIVDVFNQIKDPNSKLFEETKLLRTVYTYSKERYREMKTRLPFISCSHFNPNHRKFENFDLSIGWILDIDMDEKMEESLLNDILCDQRIVLAYTSPNGLGLKLLFLFEEKIQDKINYTNAYKAFTHEFGLKYGILTKMDLKNCDLSRISFLCHDSNCIMREEYTPINFTEYISILPDISQNKGNQNFENNITPTVYKNILEKLGARAKPIQSKPFVPNQLLLAIEPLYLIMEEHGISIVKHEEVQYGIKLCGRINNDQGEIIIYHGKKGWSVVSSAKKGLHHDLNEIMKQVAENFLFTTLFLS